MDEIDLLPPEAMAIHAEAAAIVSETDAAHSSDDDDFSATFDDHGNQLTTSGAERRQRERREQREGRDGSDGRRRRRPRNESAMEDIQECDSSADDEPRNQRNQRNPRESNDGNKDGNDDTDSDMDESHVDGGTNNDFLYCENMDDEDEAWVYKHMRSGQEEVVRVRQPHPSEQSEQQHLGSEHAENAGNGLASRGYENGSNDDEQSNNLNQLNSASASSPSKNANENDIPSQSGESSHLQNALLLKPRTSDAILSCPRCFTIVCMDCQQHSRYANQYRAMFVMNIGVDWEKRMMYDDALGSLKPASSGREDHRSHLLQMNLSDGGPDTIPHEEETSSNHSKEKEDMYYSVHCGYCRWEVAALDMTDEIYYFYGCIASA